MTIEELDVDYVGRDVDPSSVTGPLLAHVLVDESGRVIYRSWKVSEWLPVNFRFEARALQEAEEIDRLAPELAPISVWSWFEKKVVRR